MADDQARPGRRPPARSCPAPFTVQEPNRLWVGDLSYLRCWEGVVYFAFVIDAFSRRVVGWQLATHMRTTLVLDALRMALGTREHGADFRLVAHTDRGSQPGLNRSSQRCVGHWTVRDAENAAVVA